MRTMFWLAGGVSTGLGVLLATLYGFVIPGGDVATNVSQLGADALPNIELTGTGWGALALVIIGSWMMIKANSTAWKQTGGY